MKSTTKTNKTSTKNTSKNTKATKKAKTSSSSVTIAGRDGAKAYFEKSGIRFNNPEYMRHNPFIVFREDDSTVQVELVEDSEQLIKMPSTTKVMAQWPGKARSDYFKFTVGDLRKYCRENPARSTEVI